MLLVYTAVPKRCLVMATRLFKAYLVTLKPLLAFYGFPVFLYSCIPLVFPSGVTYEAKATADSLFILFISSQKPYRRHTCRILTAVATPSQYCDAQYR